MTPIHKTIEYYFYHYHEYSFTSSKKLSAFQNAIIPRKTFIYMRKNGCSIQPNSFDLLMGHVVEKTYRDAKLFDRELIRLRYFYKWDRISTCEKLQISTRTYHRKITELLNFAEELMYAMQDETAEFDKHHSFFENRNYTHEIPDYFSNHTFENL